MESVVDMQSKTVNFVGLLTIDTATNTVLQLPFCRIRQRFHGTVPFGTVANGYE